MLPFGGFIRGFVYWDIACYVHAIGKICLTECSLKGVVEIGKTEHAQIDRCRRERYNAKHAPLDRYCP